jgi:hypothetical protein
LEWYISFSRDPILIGARGTDPAWGWIRSFIVLEGVFQVPCFILGAIGLWNSDKRVYRESTPIDRQRGVDTEHL